ncbi:hypothetical protein ACP70R_011378 [Stipagrostis hirtigluma subsp. patula]
MGIPWVLLDRDVTFVYGEAAVLGGTSEDGGGTSKDGGGTSKEAAVIRRPMRGLDVEDEIEAMEASLRSMKTDPIVFAPPKISRLSMVLPTTMEGGVELHGGVISSTDKALVLLYAGDYSPGFSGCETSGCHLVFDASSNSLCPIPQLPDSFRVSGLGRGGVILYRGKGAYVVAELLAKVSGFPDAELYMWVSPNPNCQWIRKEVCLPPQVFTRSYLFRIDTAFSYEESSACWVDLLQGVVICNLLREEEPSFTFVPLPAGYSIDVPNRRRRPRPAEFRSMGCVGGVIKFVALLGIYEKYPRSDMFLKTWTLSPDFKEWKEGTTLCIGDLWASESFLQKGLPQVTPSYPILGLHEDEVYISLNDVDQVDAIDAYDNVYGVRVVPKGHYVLRVDMLQMKIISSTAGFHIDMAPQMSDMVASEFSAYLKGSKGEEPREPGASRKRKH